MASLQAKIVKALLRVKPYRWAKGSVEDQRARQEALIRRMQVNQDIQFQPVHLNGFMAEWALTPDPKPLAVLYLHGGAYALGSLNVHRGFLARFAAATGAQVLAINYRLAPEHPFPAALEDALSAYQWLLIQGFDPARVVIAGDSAGGGLTLATIAALRDAAEPLPACAVCISPWVDLTFSSRSIHTKASADPLLHADVLAPYVQYYAGGCEKSHPLISPLFADFEGFPPLLIHVGTEEILLDEVRQLVHNAQAAGVDVSLKLWQGLFHVFQMVPFLPESKQSLTQISAFINHHVHPID